MPRRKLSRAEKWLLFGTTFLILLPLGAAVGWQSINSEPEWDFPAPVPTPQPNGYDYYLRAGKAIQPPPALEETTRLTPAQRSARQARLQQWLRANSAGFALLRQAQKLPSVEPEVVVKAGYSNVHADFRQLGRDKSAEATAHLLAGDSDRAFESGLDILQLASDSSRGGGTLSFLTATAIQELAWPPLDTSLERLTATQAERHAARLAAMQARAWTLQDALRMEMWSSLRLLKSVMEDKKWRNIKEWDEDAGPREAISFYLKPKRAFQTDLMQGYARYIERAQRPFVTAIAHGRGHVVDPLTRLQLPTNFRVLDCLYCRDQVRWRMLLCRLQLQAYRVRHGFYPDSLQAVAALTPAQYTDPFPAGAPPLRYRREKNGYLLWSLGPDGRDDNGRSIQPLRGGFPQVEPDATGDIALRVD